MLEIENLYVYECVLMYFLLYAFSDNLEWPRTSKLQLMLQLIGIGIIFPNKNLMHNGSVYLKPDFRKVANGLTHFENRYVNLPYNGMGYHII